MAIYLKIFNETKRKINDDLFKKAAKIFVKILGIKDLKLNLILVGKRKIKELNKTYRGINQATDVLSFENKFSKEFLKIDRKWDKNFLGEIFICLPVAKKQAKEKNHSLFQELTILFIHGILHLVGYDHERSLKKAKEMKKIENFVFCKIKKLKISNLYN